MLLGGCVSEADRSGERSARQLPCFDHERIQMKEQVCALTRKLSGGTSGVGEAELVSCRDELPKKEALYRAACLKCAAAVARAD